MREVFAVALLLCAAPLMGQSLFGAQQVIATNADFASSVYAADVDGDGDLDVLSASALDDKIAWYANTDGLGAFGAQQVISTSAGGAQSVYAADIDGDGDIDVLSASSLDDKIAWYENTDGQGTFGAQQIISTSAHGANSVYAADIDGDGDVDVLSASSLDDKIAWYENTDGLGAFGPERLISTSADGAQSVYAADIDGDGDVDVFSASGLDDKIAWYENTDGLGAFGPEQLISTSADGAESVYAADIDGDGDVDVLSASGLDDKIAWYENSDGLGAFGAQQVISSLADGAASVYAADVDGDGDLDVLAASFNDDRIALYENTDGLGAFGPERLISASASGPGSVFAADVDGDGDDDVLTASASDDKIAWHENLRATATETIGVGCGDFGPIFPNQWIITTNADGAYDVHAADIDGDGDVDALSASYVDGKVAWYENANGLGAFGPQQVISADAAQARSVYAADVDGDGDLDALSASISEDKIAWYENTNGLGNFGPQRIISTSADGAVSVYATDIDGDGDVDVLSASVNDDKIAWYENTNGLGNFGPQQVISTNANRPQSVYAADIDGDGDIDVLSASRSDDKIAWYENSSGLGDFGGEQTISTLADGAWSVYAADVDGDGDVDVLSASLGDNKVAWYENTDGLGTFGSQRVISTNAVGANDVFTADIDGDGDVDVLSASVFDDQVAWYENLDGLGNFGSQLVISTNADGARAVYAADIDGDCDVDVLSASIKDNKIAWYENLRASALTLSANALQLGGTWTLQSENVVGATAIFCLGDTAFDPGFSLSPLGANGCSIYTNTVYGCYPRAAINCASSMPWSVPNDPSLFGCKICAQSSCAAADPANTLTFSTSNGVRAAAGY